MHRIKLTDHLILILGVLFLLLPIWVVFASSTHRPETLLADGLQFGFGDYFWETYSAVLFENTGFTQTVNAVLMLKNSLILGLGFSVGKILISTIAAYAIVYFRFPAGSFFFWIIFSSLLLPLEVRIIPSYEAIFIIMFVVGWNQYLWPILMTTDESYFTVVMGIKQILNDLEGNRIPQYNKALALSFLAMLPPVMVVLIFQRWFVKGLVESEK